MSSTTSSIRYINKTFTSFEDFSNTLMHWKMNANILSKGKMHGKIKILDVGDVILARTSFNGILEQVGKAPKDSRTFLFPANKDQSYIWHNKHISSNNLLLFPKNGEYSSISYQDTDLYSLSIKNEHLEKLIKENSFCNLWQHITDDEKFYKINNNLIYYLHSYIDILFNKAQQNNSNLEYSLIKAIKYKFPQMLLSYLEKNETIELKKENKKRDEAFYKVRKHINNNIKNKITIQELINVAKTSERTLEYAFKEKVSLSPKTYITFTKLNYIRKELTHNNKKQLVSDIASNYGFTHMGQFSADYKKLFGELPSKTLNLK